MNARMLKRRKRRYEGEFFFPEVKAYLHGSGQSKERSGRKK